MTTDDARTRLNSINTERDSLNTLCRETQSEIDFVSDIFVRDLSEIGSLIDDPAVNRYSNIAIAYEELADSISLVNRKIMDYSEIVEENRRQKNRELDNEEKELLDILGTTEKDGD